MIIEKREERFLRERFNGVQHTTLNPEGPGVVRIHLVPPRPDGDGLSASSASSRRSTAMPDARSATRTSRRS